MIIMDSFSGDSMIEDDSLYLNADNSTIAPDSVKRDPAKDSIAEVVDELINEPEGMETSGGEIFGDFRPSKYL